uniref:SPK domain-containing protein n=2 Tax=Caenorhabditis tropicalis TaxID=1561998 RepID=A0A1I7U3Q6_9PELO
MEPPDEMAHRTTRPATFLEFREILDDYVEKSIDTMNVFEESEVLRRCKPIRTIGFIEKYRNFHIFLLDEIDQYNKNVDVSRSNLKNGKVEFERVQFNFTAIKLWEGVLEHLFSKFSSEKNADKDSEVCLQNRLDLPCNSVQTTLKAAKEIVNCIENRTVIGMELNYIEFIIEKESEQFDERRLLFEYHFNAQMTDVRRQTASLMKFIRKSPEKQKLLKEKEEIMIQKYTDEIFYYQICKPFKEMIKSYEVLFQTKYPPPQNLVPVPPRSQLHSQGPIFMSPGGYVQDVEQSSTVPHEALVEEQFIEDDKIEENDDSQQFLDSNTLEDVQMTDQTDNVENEEEEVEVEDDEEEDEVEDEEEDDEIEEEDDEEVDVAQSIEDIEPNPENVDKDSEIVPKDTESFDYQQTEEMNSNESHKMSHVEERGEIPSETIERRREENQLPTDKSSDLFPQNSLECTSTKNSEDEKSDLALQKEGETAEKYEEAIQKHMNFDQKSKEIKQSNRVSDAIPEPITSKNMNPPEELGTDKSPSTFSDLHQSKSESPRESRERESSEASTSRKTSASQSPRNHDDNPNDDTQGFQDNDVPGDAETVDSSELATEEKEVFEASEVKNSEDQDLEETSSHKEIDEIDLDQAESLQEPQESSEPTEASKTESFNAESLQEYSTELNNSKTSPLQCPETEDHEDKESSKGDIPGEIEMSSETLAVPISSSPVSTPEDNTKNSEIMDTFNQTDTPEDGPASSSSVIAPSEVHSPEVINSGVTSSGMPENSTRDPENGAPEAAEMNEANSGNSSPLSDVRSLNSSDVSSRESSPRFPEVLTRNRERQPYRRFVSHRATQGRRSSVLTESSTDSSVQSSLSPDTSEESSLPGSVESEDSDEVTFRPHFVRSGRPEFERSNTLPAGSPGENSDESVAPSPPPVNDPESNPEVQPTTDSISPNNDNNSQESQNLSNNIESSPSNSIEDIVPSEEVGQDSEGVSISESRRLDTESTSQDDETKNDEQESNNIEKELQSSESVPKTNEVEQREETAPGDPDLSQNYEIHTPGSYHSSDYSSNPPSPERIQPPQVEAVFFGESPPESNTKSADDIIVVRGSRDNLDDTPEADISENSNSDKDGDETIIQNSEVQSKKEEDESNFVEELDREENDSEKQGTSPETTPQSSLKRQHTAENDEIESGPSSKEPRLDE